MRGNNKEPIFYAEEDYHFYLEKLLQGCNKHDCDVHAYILMTNHTHILLTPHHENALSKLMQMMGRYYVQYFNYSYGRTGTLWEGRYKATIIDSDRYALLCYRYIELNPVRADMVEHPGEYPWSSYRSNAQGIEDPLVTPHPLYLSLDKSSELRQAAYRDLFDAHIPTKTIDEIRASTNKAWVLGSDHFKDQIEKKLSRAVRPAQKGGDRKSEAYLAQRNS